MFIDHMLCLGRRFKKLYGLSYLIFTKTPKVDINIIFTMQTRKWRGEIKPLLQCHTGMDQNNLVL